MGGYPYEEISVDDKTFKLRLTTRGVCEVEEKHGNFMGKLGETEEFSLSTYVSVIEAALFDYHKARANRDTAAMIFDNVADKDGLAGVGTLVRKLLETFAPFKKATEALAEGNSEDQEKNESKALAEDEPIGSIS